MTSKEHFEKMHPGIQCSTLYDSNGYIIRWYFWVDSNPFISHIWTNLIVYVPSGCLSNNRIRKLDSKIENTLWTEALIRANKILLGKLSQ